MTLARQELVRREVTPQTPTHSKVDRHIKVDVPDFEGEQGVDTFLDWKHRVKSFFKMYEVSEVRKFQFVEFKLTSTTQIWWNTYKKGMSKSDNGNLTT